MVAITRKGIQQHFEHVPLGALFYNNGEAFIKGFFTAGSCEVGMNVVTGEVIAFSYDAECELYRHATLNPEG